MLESGAVMEEHSYRSKLRTPKKELKTEPTFWGSSTLQSSFDPPPSFSYSHFLNTPSPAKRKSMAASEFPSGVSPFKGAEFLRTPSPFRVTHRSPHRPATSCKVELATSPSPHKTDLFGNRSLLDNLPMPEWDEHFLDNFQEDLLFGIGSEDIEGLVRSPLKSPKKGPVFSSHSPMRYFTTVSPFKSPLLTSSPKLSADSPSSFLKTPGLAGGRPLTRQRKLFLCSPERQQPSSSTSSGWPRSLPFSSLDDTSSSLYSDGHETTTSIQSMSTFMKNFDDDEFEDDSSAMPPIGWETTSTPVTSENNNSGKGKKKSTKVKYSESAGTLNPNQVSGSSSSSHSKKTKAEPQFTLLRPYTEIHNNQICLRLTTGAPPNKIKISRDFSQIQTLPSKEQLRIVRNRFRETLNKAVEQVVEKEKAKKSKELEKMGDPTLRSVLQRPVLMQAVATTTSTVPYILSSTGARKSLSSRKRKFCTS